jgi:hypothetical protein
MKTKQLIWTNTVFNNDKIFILTSTVEKLGLRYSIRNFKYADSDVENKHYLFCTNELIGEFFNPEYAKLEAQEHLKNYILNMFFE